MPSSVALDVAAVRASRAHGSRLAWCSTTVVTTTSSGAEPQPVGEVVDRLGRVAADDGDVVACRSRPANAERRRACVLVGRGRHLRLVAGAAVHARVPRQEVVDPARDGGQRGRRGGGVEGEVRALDAVDARHELVVADESRSAGCVQGQKPWVHHDRPRGLILWDDFVLSSHSVRRHRWPTSSISRGWFGACRPPRRPSCQPPSMPRGPGCFARHGTADLDDRRGVSWGSRGRGSIASWVRSSAARAAAGPGSPMGELSPAALLTVIYSAPGPETAYIHGGRRGGALRVPASGAREGAGRRAGDHRPLPSSPIYPSATVQVAAMVKPVLEMAMKAGLVACKTPARSPVGSCVLWSC